MPSTDDAHALLIAPSRSARVSAVSRRSLRRVLQLLGAAVAVLLLWRTFADMNLTMVRRLLLEGGVGLILVPLPVLLGNVAEVLGWRFVFANLRRPVAALTLLRVRMISDAVQMSVSGGGLAADALTPYLLHRGAGVPVSEGAVAVAARKCLLLVSNGTYVVLATLVGFSFLQERSQVLIGVSGLQWLAVLTGVGMFASAGLFTAAVTRGSLACALHGLLLRLPGQRLRAAVAGWRAQFEATDACFSRRFMLRGQALIAAGALQLGAWLCEALETWIILHLLGAELSFMQVLTAEALLSFLRSMTFFVPAGLGVQDAGYVAFLHAFGVPDALNLGAAFVLIKRAKELLWVLVGYSLFGGLRRSTHRGLTCISHQPT